MVKFRYNEMSGSVSVFIAKLWALTDDKNTDQLIAWSQSGLSFMVFHPNVFAKQVLPKYFKHNNMTSFVRQLNMYGFRKIANIEQGSLSSEDDSLEFFHPYFIRGSPQLLEHIKRKPTFKSDEPKNNAICQVLSDVKLIKNRQMDLENRMEQIKLENSTLWEEILYLRDKHSKQQLIVKKLIQFLLAMISHAPNFKLKDFPYMFNNAYYNLDTKANRLRAVEQDKQELNNLKVIEFINSPPDAVYQQHNQSSIKGNLDEITTDLGLPSAGMITDADLLMEQDHFLNPNPPAKSGEMAGNYVVTQDEIVDVPSPLLEVEINSEPFRSPNSNQIPLQTLNSDLATDFEMLDEVSLARNLLNQPTKSAQFCTIDNKNLTKQERFPKALLDHIINFANDAIEPPPKYSKTEKIQPADGKILHKDPFFGVTTSGKNNPSNTNYDFDESIFHDLMDDTYINSSNTQAPSLTTDLVLANKDLYRNDFNLLDLQNLLNNHNLSIDTRLLMDIMNNIENNEILPLTMKGANAKDTTTNDAIKDTVLNSSPMAAGGVSTSHHNETKNKINVKGETVYNMHNDTILKDEENIFDNPFDDDDEYVLMDTLPFLSQETFSPSLSDIVAFTLNENKSLQRMNSSLRTPLLSPEPRVDTANVESLFTSGN